MEARIRNVMAQVLGMNPAEIGSHTSNAAVKRWDSIGHMNLCAALEEEFGVMFDADQVVEMTSYDRIVSVIGAASAAR